MTQIPHFALPFRIVAGSAVVNEQDSFDEVADCVLAIESYTTGGRPEKPEFGIPDQAFRQGGPDPAEIEAAVNRWEPRASALVEADVSSLGRLTASVTTTTEESS